MIKLFFEYLATRRYKENDLSDITWALCHACPDFKRIFIHFFFPDLEIDLIEYFERETRDDDEGDSRVDFLIRIKGDDKPFLIEVKIGDRNHHFGQYEKAYHVGKERLGYITNYSLHMSGYMTKTWEMFFDELAEQIKYIQEDDSLKLINGYSSYLQNVCGIIKFNKAMKLDGMYSLYQLMVELRKLINRSEEDFTLELYSDKNGNRNGVQGLYFRIDYTTEKIAPTWAWIGIYYNREKPLICISFSKDEGWGKPVYDILSESVKENGIYAASPYKEGNSYWFELSEKKHEEFETLPLQEQRELLKNFMDEVIRYPLKAFKQ